MFKVKGVMTVRIGKEEDFMKVKAVEYI